MVHGPDRHQTVWTTLYLLSLLRGSLAQDVRVAGGAGVGGTLLPGPGRRLVRCRVWVLPGPPAPRSVGAQDPADHRGVERPVVLCVTEPEVRPPVLGTWAVSGGTCPRPRQVGERTARLCSFRSVPTVRSSPCSGRRPVGATPAVTGWSSGPKKDSETLSAVGAGLCPVVGDGTDPGSVGPYTNPYPTVSGD